MKKIKWTKVTCFEEAKKYQTRSEFQKGNSRAYYLARINGWLDEYTWMPKHEDKPRGYWTRETCFEEAKKYKRRIDFAKKSGGAYKVALRNGWLYDYIWFDGSNSCKHSKWTRKQCYEEAKKYKTRGEFCRKSYAYRVAKDNGWLDDYVWFELIEKKPKNYWTYEQCYEEAKKYKTRGEFYRKAPSVYRTALRKGWIDDFTWLLSQITKHDKDDYSVYAYIDNDNNVAYVGLTFQIKRRHREHINGKKRRGVIHFDSVAQHFNSINKDLPEPILLIDGLSGEDAQFFERFFIIHYTSLGFKMLNKAKAGSLGTGGIKWGYEQCYEEAKKYQSRSEFCLKSKGAYASALKNGWIDNYVWLGSGKQWTYERCYDEAKKYKTKTEFRKKSPWVYEKSCKNGWLEKYTWLQTQRKSKYNYEICKSLCSECKNRTELIKKHYGCLQWLRKHHKNWLDEFLPKTPISVRKKRGTRVALYKNDVEIKTFNSIIDTARYLNVNYHTLQNYMYGIVKKTQYLKDGEKLLILQQCSTPRGNIRKYYSGNVKPPAWQQIPPGKIK